MTFVTDPRVSNFWVGWPIYRVGKDVYIQHAVMFRGESAEAFDPAASWGHLATGNERTKAGTRSPSAAEERLAKWIIIMDHLTVYYWVLR